MAEATANFQVPERTVRSAVQEAGITLPRGRITPETHGVFDLENANLGPHRPVGCPEIYFFTTRML